MNLKDFTQTKTLVDGFEMTLVIWNPHINKVQIPSQILSIEKENCYSYPVQVI